MNIVVSCMVQCPYCKEKYENGFDQHIQDLCFVEDAESVEVELDDLVTRCPKCNRRFVVSIDLSAEVFEVEIVGEDKKPNTEIEVEAEQP